MKKKLSITLDVDVIKQIEELCIKEERTTSNMINILLKLGIKEFNSAKSDH